MKASGQVLLRQVLVLLAGAVLTLMAIMLIAQALQLLPIPATKQISEIYWAAPWGGDWWQKEIGFILTMLQEVWLLWLVPLAGIIITYMVYEQVGNEAVEVYMVRIHEVETALKQARDHADSAQQKWDEFNHKMDELFEGTGEAFMVISGGRNIRRWNKPALELARRSSPHIDSLEGRLLEDVANEPALLGAVAEATRDGKVWSGELHIAKIGTRLMGWALPMGESVLLVLRDVTPLHRDQGFLQNTEILLRQTVEDSIRPIAVLDAGWRYVYVARTWHETLGLPTTVQLIGMDHRQVMPDFPPDVRVVEQQLQGGQAVGKEEERRVLQGKDVVW
ncbi:MAG: PAS domain-containing protein, partial [Proteobacteria bacterium]|nr:PAS domain-containing protein [Pseudomonadota bacterium]